ncbi:serine hydroxymethyltransferase, partial [Clostridioides difficile]|nr:serine hydroxymethyltransferase [Clostridioides difficile]
MLKTTKISDPELYKIVADELVRQEHNIEMIASESTAPTEVLELSGCVFTNKTEEGYPGARFQAGSEEADKLETLAIKRAKEVFGAEHVNVQPYSGSTANYCVYSSILKPNDTVLSMRLDQGGHLTHG